MDKQEFLQRLENPVRFRLREQMKNFAYNVPYYMWEQILNVRTYERNGSHEAVVTLRTLDAQSYVVRKVNDFFPPSQDYRVVTGGMRDYHGPPDGDLVHEFRFAVVEEANYEN